MRHKKKKSSINMGNEHQKAMMRNLATSVILYERVKTTKKRAKLIAPVVEKLITISKEENKMNAIRKINKIVFDKNASKKLMEELSVKYKDRDSGYTRLTSLGNRAGDNAPVSLIELV